MKKLLLSALLALAAIAGPLAAQGQTTCVATPAANLISVGVNSSIKDPGFEITANTTWTNNNIYLLTSVVYVNDGVTLTIQPGTIIKGQKANQGSLVIRQGGKLIAAGTATQPIVFTSDQPAGSRAPGDWGGIILCGRARTNHQALTQIEGGVKAFFGGPTATNDADNSGVLQYVRIEYPGIAFALNNEINGLTLGGVGYGTTIDHIQVTSSGDDSFEWFGGAVNAKYLIALGGTDDDFDTDNGFSGRVQFGFALRDPAVADFGPGGFSNGFESDNDAAGSAFTPQTSAVFTNCTMLLPQTTTPVSPFVNAAGALIRRNSAISVFNTVLTGRTFGVDLNSNSVNLTTANAAGGSLAFQNNVLAGYAPLPSRAGRVSSNSGVTAGFDIRAFIGASSDTTKTYAAIGLNADNFAFNGNCSNNKQCTPNLVLPTNSYLTTGAAFTNAKLTGAGNGGPNSTFDVVAYRGAFGATNWAAGWTNFNPQITCYNTPGAVLANREAANAPLQALTVSPNPTQGAATLGFDVKTATTATVRVLDVMGREVAVVLTAGKLGAGPQRLALPANLAPGVYVATVATPEAVQSVRFVVAQ